MTDKELAFRELSVRFLREVKNLHGTELARTVTHSLREHLGDSWSGQVTHDVLADKWPEGVRFHITFVPDEQRIETVKAIRALTGMGLFDAKQMMQRAAYGTEPAIVTTEQVEDESTDSMAARALQFERRIHAMGCKVERYYGE